MTKEEHILFWAKQVDQDFDCANVLYMADHFAQSLFLAHLALEKLTKALWIKKNEEIHPLLFIIYFVWLHKQTNIFLRNNYGS